MKKIVSLALLLTGISLATFAQEQRQIDRRAKNGDKHPRQERRMENRSPEEIAKLKTDRLDKELKFTDAQRKKVYAIELGQAKRQTAHRAEMKKLQDKWHQEMKGSHQELDKVLTAEQKQQMKEKLAQGKHEKVMRRKNDTKGRRQLEVQQHPAEKVAG